MKKLKISTLLLCAAMMFSCGNNTGNGALIGAGGGALLGGIIGNIIGKDTKATAIGAAIGSAVGAGGGALIGKKMDKAKAAAQAIENAKVEGITDANGQTVAVKVTFESGILFGFNSSVLSDEAKAAWDGVKSGLNAAWGTPDLVYSRSEVPQNLASTYATTAWRGEKASAQLVLWTVADLEGVECEVSDFRADGAKLPSSIAEAHFVRYTIADKSGEECRCARPNGHPAILQADMLDNVASLDVAAKSARPVWISIAVPQDAKAGLYKATVKVSHNGSGSVVLPLELKVVDEELAKPSEWHNFPFKE